MKLTKKLIQETKALIQLYLFLERDCGLRDVDKLSAKDLRCLLRALIVKDKG